MQKYAVIGLGRFGSRLAVNLVAAGAEVIGIDKDQALIEQMRDRVTLAVALDATDEQALRLQGVDQVDVAILSIGNDFESIALATVLLKQIGVPKVISRAVTAISAKILSSIGADEVVNPEDESADRWANRLVSPQFINHVELDESYSIVEIRPPAKWVERTLIELKLRTELGVHVIAMKRRRDPEKPNSPLRMQLPRPDRALAADDVLGILGQDEDLAKLPIEE
jgi:trk system potassium uptake protein TrkA